MTALLDWCGFLGAWLLFAGPVYQAAIELNEQDFERDRFEQTKATVDKPAPIAPWWWLIPVVGYFLQRRRSEQYRHAVMAALDPVDREQLVGYMSKARGWVLVAVGGLLLAARETWSLCQHYDWPQYVFWLLAVAMAVLSAVFTVGSLRGDQQAIKQGQE